MEPTRKVVLDKNSEPVDSESLNTTSLEALQAMDQRKIMDVIDKLRRTGLDSILGLPQLVVCGDQSSGKSSVLEAITGIPFPRKENLCTRFATEIVLRRSNSSSISTNITPDKTRPSDEIEKLQRFTKSITSFHELPALIDEATAIMGLDSGGGGAMAFARDVLSIEICGPGRPQLTLVDLPGLIHAKNKSQSESDIHLIRGLVEEYISNDRTIILAVISAKNDYANQIILEYCRRVDAKGSRTLGIITKPDYLRAGSDNERAWIDLAKNNDVYFELGWHMVKNREEGDISSSLKDRNDSESLFFSKGNYRDLPRNMLGIDALRLRLSQLLQNHLKQELPGLKKELDMKLLETANEISLLGSERSTLAEQRQYLMGVSMKAHDIFRSAIHGHYEHPFFGSVNTDAAVDAAENTPRLRAVIQHLNLRFACTMRLCGQKFAVDDKSARELEDVTKEAVVSTVPSVKDTEGSSKDELDPSDMEEIIAGTTYSKKIPREKAIDWVLKVLQRSRGRELPDNFNPMLISQLFWEQSDPWNAIALAHIKQVANTCGHFVELVLQQFATPEVQSRLHSLKVEPTLQKALSASLSELGRIIEDKNRHPITYNHSYTRTIQKLRQEKYGQGLMRVKGDAIVEINEKTWTGGRDYTTKKYIHPELLKAAVTKEIEEDMDKFSAEEALDSEIAFYKDEMEYFIGVITKQVIERHLVDALPTSIISPLIVAALSDEEVRYIAAETTEVTQKRNYLKARKEVLQLGQETFRKAMGGLN